MAANKGVGARMGGVLDLSIVTDPAIRLQLFGAMEAWSYTGENILPRGRKAQAILSYLALTADASVPRRRLVELLWSARWAEQGKASLRQSLIDIRTAIGRRHEGLIAIERDRVILNRRLVWIDGLSIRADSESVQAVATAPPNAERLLETLMGLDPKFDDWIRSTRIAVAAAMERVNSTGESGQTRRPAPRAYVAQDKHDLPGFSNNLLSAAVTDQSGESLAPVVDLRPRRLTISIVPFVPIGSSRFDDYLSPALTQEISTSLARFRWMHVRLGEPAERSDAHYRLEGYLSRLGDDCRVVVRLIDQTDRDIIVWTCSEETPFPLQDTTVGAIVRRVVEQLDPEVLAIETRKVLRRPTVSRDAYECVLRAIPLLYRFDKESWRNATALLADAMAIDPQYGRAFAFAALCRTTGVAQGWSDNVAHDTRRIAEEAETAVACDPHDSLALALGAHTKAFLHHDFLLAQNLFERAIRANPSCGFSWGYSSLTFAYLAETDEAMRRLERARAIMIHDPFCSFLDAFHAVIAYFSKDWSTAIAICRRVLERRPSFTNIRKLLIASLCFLRQFDEAAREQDELIRFEHDFTWVSHLVRYPFGRSQDRIDLEAALRHAGLIPERPNEERTRAPFVRDHSSVVALRPTRRSKRP